jgi:hypothetical protein
VRGHWRAVVPPGLIPDGDGTRTTLGAWDLCDLMNQLDAIYPARVSAAASLAGLERTSDQLEGFERNAYSTASARAR